MRRVIWVLGFGLVSMLALYSCGGDDSTTSVSTQTVTADNETSTQSSAAESTTDADQSQTASGPSTEDFLDQADAICSDLNEQVDDLPTETLAQIEQATAASYAAVNEGISRLQQLEVPTELETEFDQFLAAAEDQNAVIKQLHDAAAAGDVQAAQSLVPDLERARDRKSQIAIKAGFAECGST